VISRSISAYLVQAWDVRNSCKHNGAVLPLSAAPVGRGADGVDAMVSCGNLMMMMRTLRARSSLHAYILCTISGSRTAGIHKVLVLQALLGADWCWQLFDRSTPGPTQSLSKQARPLGVVWAGAQWFCWLVSADLEPDTWRGSKHCSGSGASIMHCLPVVCSSSVE
jgi:hypothetical protein